MSHITISLVEFACAFGGVLIGLFTHSRLPND